MDPRPILSNGVVRRVDGKIFLLFHREVGKWILPGGHVDEGDTPEYTLKKELSEEIGIVPTNYELIRHGHFLFTDGNGVANMRRCYLYDVYDYKGFPFNREPHQHSKIDAFDLDELRNMVDMGNVTEHIPYYLQTFTQQRGGLYESPP